jgi:hypothetical protein
MNLLRPLVKFSGRQLFTQLSPSCSCRTTHQAPQSPQADLRITKRVAAAAQILQNSFLDHVIVGQAMVGGRGSSVSRKQDFCKYLRKPNW